MSDIDPKQLDAELTRLCREAACRAGAATVPMWLFNDLLGLVIAVHRLHMGATTTLAGNMTTLTENVTEFVEEVQKRFDEGGGNEPITFDLPRFPAGSGINGN